MYRKVFIALGFCLVIVGLVGITKASIMPIKAIIGQQYLEVAWKESLRANKLSKPWRSADFHMIGKLTVPKLKISRVILNSSTGEAMAWGIGRVHNAQSSSMDGPIILAGHRDSHMQFMSQLSVGDKIELMMTDGILKTYTISNSLVLETQNFILSQPLISNSDLILTTCYPINELKTGNKRYILYAENLDT